LDFGRGKCIPCKKMAPILKELSEEYKGRVIIKIIEIDQEKELTRVNRIRLIPTQIFFDSKNNEVFRHEGFMDKEAVKKIFQQMGVQ
jgi:thioredoxin 1